MNILDIRTVLFGYVMSNGISVAVMYSLWKYNRRRSPELGYWLVNFTLLLIALLALVLRGIVPEGISIMLGYPLTLWGTLLMYIGLELYTGKRSSQWHNLLLLVAFVTVHAYFSFAQPSLQTRDIAFTLVLLVYHCQCAWLLLGRVDFEMKQITRTVGMVWVAYILVNLLKLFVVLTTPPNHSLFTTGLYDTLLAVCYQMLTIILTYALVLMVNRRLLTELEIDIEERKLAEVALKKSEEKFSVAFRNSPNVVTLTSLMDGKIVEANDTFFRVTGFAFEESLGKTIIELNLWENLTDREQFVELLKEQGRVLNFETNFRRKSGVIFTGWISGEIIELQGSHYALSVIHDITERKVIENALMVAKQQAETANRQLKESLKREEKLSRTDPLTGILNRGRFFELAVFEFNKSKRYTHPLAILMLDIDHFKRVNDKYGHPTGDVVLRVMAETIERELRSADVLGRYGGEEFVVLLPVTNRDQAMYIAERLLNTIRAEKVKTGRGIVQVTISMGLATRLPTDDSIECMIDRADQLLYIAKQDGRDRIVVEN